MDAPVYAGVMAWACSSSGVTRTRPVRRSYPGPAQGANSTPNDEEPI